MKIKSLKQRDKRLSKVEKLLSKREYKLTKEGYVNLVSEDTETAMCEGMVKRFLLGKTQGIDTNILFRGGRMVELMGDRVYFNLAKEREELCDYQPPRTFEENYNAGCVKQSVDTPRELKRY